MVARIRVQINEKGVRELLTSAPIRADVEARATRIAYAAGGPPDFEVVGGTTDRAHASAVTSSAAGRRAEAEDRVLTRAIDAGR